VFKQEFSFGLKSTDLTFKLSHFIFDHGTYSLHLGLEQLKDRMVKSSTMSQVICSTIILEFLQAFKIKLRDYIMTLLTLSKYMVFVDPHQGRSDVMPFFSYN
jgi:hypothetical protein